MLNIKELEGYTPKEIEDLKTNFSTLLPTFRKLIENLEKYADKSNEELKNAIDILKQCEIEMADVTHTFSIGADLDRQLEDVNALVDKTKNAIDIVIANTTSDTSNLFKILRDLVNNAHPTGRFLKQPVGLKEIAWLLNYRAKQLEQFSELSEYDQTLKEFIDNLIKQLYTYQEGKIEVINNIVTTIETFEATHLSDIERRSPWLLGLKQECQIIQKRHEAVMLRNRLDEINIELIGNKNEIELKHARALHELKDRYKIDEKKEMKKEMPNSVLGRIWYSIKSAFSFFNVAKDLRREKYLNNKIKLSQKLKEDLQKATKSHEEKYGSEIKQLESKFNKIKIEVSTLDNRYIGSVVMPLSFQSHRKIKEMASKNGALVIGGLAQNKVISLGSSNGLCYGFTKEWLLHLNTLRDQDLEDHVVIDRLNLYSKKSEDDKSIFINQVNNLVVNEKVYKHFDEQTHDKLKAKKKFRKDKPIDKDFGEHILEVASDLNPPSIIVTINSSKGGAHALGVAKTKHGIWFHDSNYACIYFPYNTSKETTQKQFSHFIDEYLKVAYPDFKSASFVPISEKISMDESLLLSKKRGWTSAFKILHKVGEKSKKSKLDDITLGMVRLKP